jgi:hypothetical protein
VIALCGGTIDRCRSAAERSSVLAGTLLSRIE